MEQSAGELRDFVGKVLQVTGASKVDIVGHSEGSLMPDYYVKFLGGASQVNHYVGLAPLWNGSTVSLATLMAAATSNYTAYCAACSQVLTGSPFLQNLNAGGAAVPGVRYTMVLSKLDGIVTPYTSGVLQGADNVVVQDLCATDSATHAALAGDPVAAQVVFNALSPGSVPQVQCAPVGSPPP
jgi:triacylglycerol esterase/lipase EstA (alpha/beta hydrolase family)